MMIGPVVAWLGRAGGAEASGLRSWRFNSIQRRAKHLNKRAGYMHAWRPNKLRERIEAREKPFTSAIQNRQATANSRLCDLKGRFPSVRRLPDTLPRPGAAPPLRTS
jgi:hypothetical protein